jgi:hypothetical protein
VAAGATLIAPVTLGVAVVLTAISTAHRGLRSLLGSWIAVAIALACTAFALAALAGHMPV